MLEDIYSKYTNINRIAKSNSSIIYVAKNKITKEPVVIKEFFFDRLNFSEEAGNISFKDQVQRFEREIEIHSSLEHKNIIKFIEFFEKESEIYMILEYVDGVTIEEIINNKIKIGFLEIINIGIKISDALQYMHDKGIIHRDIKPSNIILADNGHVSLIDLGCAKKIYNQKITITKMLVGTVIYMSPEQILGLNETDGRSDIFSLGAVLYQLLTNTLPFDGNDIRESIYNVFHSEPENIRNLNYLVPENLEKIINQTLKKDPDHRCNTAKMLKYHLEKILEDPEIYYSQGKFFEVCNEPEKAIEMYLISVSIKPSFEPLKAIADILYAKEDLNDALEYYKNALNFNSSDYYVYEKIGDIYYKLLRYNDSINFYQKSIILNYNNVLCEIKIAQTLFLADKIQDSISYYKSIIERFPYNVKAFYELGIIYYKIGNKIQASSTLEKAVYLSPFNSEILFYLGSIYQENNETEKAIPIYERIEKEKPDFQMLLQNLSCAYYQNGDYSKAKEKIKKLIKMGFESFQGSVLLGHISEQENNIEEAINSYKKAIELDKYNLSAYLYLAGCLRNNWRLDEAMNILNIATKINTLDSKSEVYYQYAESLREKGLYSEAKKMYKECIIITRPGKLQEIAKKQLESIFNYENKTSEYKKVTLFQSRYVV